MKHLLKMLDLSTEEITQILDLADQLKYEKSMVSRIPIWLESRSD